jgi:Endonuclease/Exonuclease/phosphatase family
MPSLKIATFNAEWMVSLFGGLWKAWQPPTIPNTFPGRRIGDIDLEPIEDVHGLCRRIAAVITDIQPDIIGIVEGPPRKDQLEAFVDQFLNGDYIVHHSNDNWQSINVLVHHSIAPQVTAWQPKLPPVSKRWTSIPYYPWGLISAEERKKHELDRHPLLISFKPDAEKELLLMVLHTKSKFSLLKTREQWDNREREAILDALNARAKLSAEIFRIREFLNIQFEQLATGDPPLSIILMGDLNDGPFADLMEQEFLIHNIVDELVGTLLEPDFHFRHAMTPQTLRTAATTQFPDPLQGGQIVEELIDHMLVSPALWQNTGPFGIRPDSCQVETQIYANHDDDNGPERKRGLRPSDHYSGPNVKHTRFTTYPCIVGHLRTRND